MALSRLIPALTFVLLCLPIHMRVALADEKLPVFVSIVPQKTFVQQIGKDRVDVQVMVQPGASPHTYEPSPRQMVAISKTKIYFAVGVAFENAWLRKITATNPNLRVVHTDHGIDKIPMVGHHHPEDNHENHEETSDSHPEGEDHHTEEKHHDEHGDLGSHPESEEHHRRENHHDEHSGLDPHIWLSPPLVKQQARTIRDALQKIDPANHSAYAANYRLFVSRIDELDTELKAVFAGKQGLQFMVFHPAWGYFARAYGLEQVPVEVEGKSPKPAQLKQLIDHAKDAGIRVIFVQPQFSTKSAELIAREIGGQVVFADPLAQDWSANLREVADKFKTALR